ncbi:hypothetical protein [Nocardia sp. alder85J]|uniref:hypothetical protein n=1 Tax=Nocardia sp. alder85J TaxID=2862949 RepID=UPI001CD2D01C|nr:hypothetical protein [Nocardia sp. alder85J]MCX4092957.1 hypothetical protein [Nocardia sp. alder85J]
MPRRVAALLTTAPGPRRTRWIVLAVLLVLAFAVSTGLHAVYDLHILFEGATHPR